MSRQSDNEIMSALRIVIKNQAAIMAEVLAIKAKQDMFQAELERQREMILKIHSECESNWRGYEGLTRAALEAAGNGH